MPTSTPTPTPDATEPIAVAMVPSQTPSAQTVEPQSLTLTAAAQPTTTPMGISSDMLALTSTALVQDFLNLTATADALANLGQGGGGDDALDATPTAEILIPITNTIIPVATTRVPPTKVTVTPVATTAISGTTTLPDTGLFDEFGAGASFGVLSLVAVGLVAMIVGARYFRTRNDDDDQNNA